MVLLSIIRPRPLLLVGLGVSSLMVIQPFQRFGLASPLSVGLTPLRCDASPSALNRYQRDAQVPIVSGGRLNSAAVKQISVGSIAGLCCGLAVSVFSKPLALLIGLLVCGVQAIESRGIHIIPYSRLQRIFTNTDITSAVQDNVAFKLCFGLTFALAAFAEL